MEINIVRFEVPKSQFKYVAVMSDDSLVHFGDRRLIHYMDSTPIEIGGSRWSLYDTLDPILRAHMRALLCKRASQLYSREWFEMIYLYS